MYVQSLPCLGVEDVLVPIFPDKPSAKRNSIMSNGNGIVERPIGLSGQQHLQDTAMEDATPESPTIDSPENDLEMELRLSQQSIMAIIRAFGELNVKSAGGIRDLNMANSALLNKQFMDIGYRARNDKIDSMKEGLDCTQNINYASFVGNGLAAVFGSGLMIAAAVGGINPNTASGLANMTSQGNLILGGAEILNRPGVSIAEQHVSFADATTQFNRINMDAAGKSEQASKEQSAVFQRTSDLMQNVQRELASIARVSVAN
jgi:hypothetical protein